MILNYNIFNFIYLIYFLILGIYSTITKGSFVVKFFIFHKVLSIINVLSNKL